MNRPPRPPMGNNNMYRNPRPYNNQWSPRGPRPHTGFQWRPNTHFGTPVLNAKNTYNEEHWCETCDRGFPSADLLVKHKQQHQKCNIDGCQFIAHPKVITKHIQMQHSTGLYKKIAKLDNPEEIQKWREERKKKYPTKKNIEQKVAACNEKIERGEKMALKQDRSHKQKPASQGKGIKRNHSFDKRNQNHRTKNKSDFKQKHLENNSTPNEDTPPPKKIPKVIPKMPAVVEKNKLKPFAGILSIVMFDDKVEETSPSNCSNSLIEDDYFEGPAQHTEEKLAQKPVLCGALSSLMCDYESTDEETDAKENTLVRCNITKPKESTATDNTTSNLEIQHNGNCKKDMVSAELNIGRKTETVSDIKRDLVKTEIKQVDNSDDDGPEEVKTVKINSDQPNSFQEVTSTTKHKESIESKNNVPTKNDLRQNNKYKHKIPSTLLQKLLYKEIRQERNIVLQCIRYIKKKNYFDKALQ